MSRQKLFPLAVAISLVVGCSHRSDDDFGELFPSRVNTRLQLPVDGQEIAVRYINMSQDGTNLETIVTEFTDGTTEYKYFRPDSTLERIEQHYVLEESSKSGKRKLRMSLLYDDDGKTLLYERTYLPDGTAAIFGSRGPDGNFRREYFQKDGKQLGRLEVIHPTGLVLLEQIFKEDGIIFQVVRRARDGSSATEDYRENGTLKWVTLQSRSPYGPIERHFYSEDGLSLLMSVRYTAHSISVTYFENGTAVEKRDIYESGTATVTVNDKDGNKIVKTYSGEPGSSDWTDISSFKLIRVTEYVGENSVKREIEFQDDGRTPKVVKYPDGSSTVYKTMYRYFREDGTLEKEEYKEDYKTIKDVKEYPVEDDIREDIPELFFERSDRKAPELLSAMPTQAPGCQYCCGEGCENCMD